MYTLRVTMSAGLEKFLRDYPTLFEDVKKSATNKSLDLLQRTSFEKAPYKTGTLRRELKQRYTERSLVAGTDLSRAYAEIQDVGGMAGRGHKSRIPAKHYFYRNAVEQQGKVLNIFADKFRELFAKV
jgi:phage gpG-like protein